MNVYVESNYILEMVFEQAEASACEELLRLAECSAIQLILPSLALVEPQETVRRRRIDRRKAKNEFDAIMVAAVLMDLDQAAGVSCFLNRNRRDFDTSAVLHELRRRDCRLITKFRQGLDFVRSATDRRAS